MKWPSLFGRAHKQDCFFCDDENGESTLVVEPGSLVPVCDKHFALVRRNEWMWTLANTKPYASGGECVDLAAPGADGVAK